MELVSSGSWGRRRLSEYIRTVYVPFRVQRALLTVQKIPCLIFYSEASFEILMAVMFEVEISWVVTPCSAAVGCQSFTGPCCSHLQNTRRRHNPEDPYLNLLF
jgi:hypothetical protein